MPTSSDLVQIAVVEEVTYGVIPSNPAFYVVRTTGEGLAFAPSTTTSNEMNALRQVTDSILTGGQSSGDLNFELSYEDWFELLLRGLMADAWSSGVEVDVIKVGDTLRSFTVEKRIPVPGGDTHYHRYTGVTINTLSLNIQPGQPITGSFGLVGKALNTPSTTALAGATYAAADLMPVMTAPKVVDIEIGGVSAVSKCFNSLQLNVNNNNRAVECIGTLGPREMLLGRMEATSQFNVLFNDSELLTTMLNQDETSLEFWTVDTSGVGSPAAENKYGWYLPKVKFTADPVVAGGTNQDVVHAVSAQGLYSAPLDTTLQISRTHRA